MGSTSLLLLKIHYTSYASTTQPTDGTNDGDDDDDDDDDDDTYNYFRNSKRGKGLLNSKK